MSEAKTLTIDNIAGGAVPELFQRELEKVLENIADVNTKADAKRSISIQIDIVPDSYRRNAHVSVSTKANTVGVRPAVNQIYFGKEGGKMRAFANDINQMEMELDSKPELVESEVVL